VFHEGERSEPEWNTTPRGWRQYTCLSMPTTCLRLLVLGCCVAFDFRFFLRRQENEADAFAQRVVGGVRELVQPSDGLGPVRSPARAAHALCSKLEPLPERQL
jgi:hypothetical protein